MIYAKEIAIIIMLLLVVAGVMNGWKKGFTHEFSTLISLALSLIVILFVIWLIGSVMRESTSGIVMASILLIVVGIVYSVINVILKGIKGLTNLPALKWLDKILGIPMGVAKAGLMIVIITKIMEAVGYTGLLSYIYTLPF